MRKTNLLFIIFWILMLPLLADSLTPLDIESLTVWLSIGAGALAAGVLHASVMLADRAQAIRLGLTLVVFIGGKLLVWRGDWQTQTIEYRHRTSPNRVIAFQMMNPGPGSYRRRRVDKTQLLPGLSWLHGVDHYTNNPDEWERVDIDVNEMGLKY